MRHLVLLLALLAIGMAGCVELGMVSEKEDCRGKARVKTLPSGYPCSCCPVGQQ